jgi:hypothetical protein
MRRKLVYVATAAAILALVAGYALATITLNSATQNAGGTYVNASGQVTGLTYTITQLEAVANPAPAASSGSALTPQAVVAGANAFCATTCTAGDLAEVVTYSFTTSLSGSIMVSIQLTATSGGGSTILYLQQAATPVAGTIAITWDAGTGGNTITSVTVTDQQCSGATCP